MPILYALVILGLLGWSHYRVLLTLSDLLGLGDAEEGRTATGSSCSTPSSVWPPRI